MSKQPVSTHLGIICIMQYADTVHQQHTARLQQGMAPHRQVNPTASPPQATVPQQAMDPLQVSSPKCSSYLGPCALVLIQLTTSHVHFPDMCMTILITVFALSFRPSLFVLAGYMNEIAHVLATSMCGSAICSTMWSACPHVCAMPDMLHPCCRPVKS